LALWGILITRLHARGCSLAAVCFIGIETILNEEQ